MVTAKFFILSMFAGSAIFFVSGYFAGRLSREAECIRRENLIYEFYESKRGHDDCGV